MRRQTKPLLAICLVVGMLLLPTASATAASSTQAQVGSRPSGCEHANPHSLNWRSGWRHGGGRSIKPPPKCGGASAKAAASTSGCKAANPRSLNWRSGWRHGGGRSIKPPPKCGQGGSSTDETESTENALALEAPEPIATPA